MVLQLRYQPGRDEPQDPQGNAMLLDLACKLRQRSWERSSSQLSSLLLETTVSDIAILVRRLGMHWIDFRPEEGIMSAEGNGQIVYSALVRSIGVRRFPRFWLSKLFVLRLRWPMRQGFNDTTYT